MQEMPNYTLHKAMRIVVSESENKTMHAAAELAMITIGSNTIIDARCNRFL